MFQGSRHVPCTFFNTVGDHNLSVPRVRDDEMPRCEICNGCWFYRSDISPASVEFELLEKYCHGAYLDCARYQFAQSLGISYLPKWLEPNDCRAIKGVRRSPIK